MFTTIWNKVKQYFGLLDDIIIDTLQDLKSLRYQLVIWAFVLNFGAFYLIYLGKADYKLATVSIGLLTAVYAFFFHSKSKQAEIENATTALDEDPKMDRNPDAE